METRYIYIDKIEEAVVNHCNENNITFIYHSDKDGHHHYSFNKIIDLNEYGSPKSVPILKDTKSFEQDWGEIKKVRWWHRLFFPKYAKAQDQKQKFQEEQVYLTFYNPYEKDISSYWHVY